MKNKFKQIIKPKEEHEGHFVDSVGTKIGFKNIDKDKTLILEPEILKKEVNESIESN